MNSNIKDAKPFLKWAGGKTQLINEIAKLIPASFKEKNFTYIEPFVGSGAVLFWIINNFPNMKKAIISDVNSDLINVYKTIQSNPQLLIEILKKHQDKFILPDNKENKKEYYYTQRERYNSRQESTTEQAALFIFLNKTCFNGLYRVNRNNQYNVPMGDYRNPTICDSDNILAVHKALQKVEILNVDYQETLALVDKTDNLFYLDPPYKPLSATSSFNAYAKDEFDDNAQIRLAEFCKNLDSLDHLWILSNSDPKNTDPENNFFDDLYRDFQIKRVQANRTINSNAAQRGKLNELIITNQ